MTVVLLKKKKQLFFSFTVREAYFTLLFHGVLKNDEFVFKEKEQTCVKRLGLKNCSAKFEVKESDGQLKYVL